MVQTLDYCIKVPNEITKQQFAKNKLQSGNIKLEIFTANCRYLYICLPQNNNETTVL